MDLAEIIMRLNEKRALPDYAAAITFDDGFQNNYTVAYPFLKAQTIPATIFLATGKVGTKNLLWPDRLLVDLWNTEKTEIDLQNNGFGKLRLRTPRERQAAYGIMLSHMKSLPVVDKNKLLKAITDALGNSNIEPLGATDFELLSWQQVHQMHNSGMVRFGAHTENHDILSRMNRQVMRAEIENSCMAIQERLKEAPLAFSYPNGAREDFNESVKQMLRDHNFLCALTTIEGLNDRNQDFYELKRIGVGSQMTQAEFVLFCSGFITWLKSLLRPEMGGR
jgi:peptidoglycan/xylan/chitin deacetylase (PgdA/CDA1 family)